MTTYQDSCQGDSWGRSPCRWSDSVSVELVSSQSPFTLVHKSSSIITSSWLTRHSTTLLQRNTNRIFLHLGSEGGGGISISLFLPLDWSILQMIYTNWNSEEEGEEIELEPLNPPVPTETETRRRTRRDGGSDDVERGEAGTAGGEGVRCWI